jgi:hypothetical protein
MAEPISVLMQVVMALSAVLIIGKILYVGTAILQGKEDPRFEDDKIIYRS